MCDIGVDFCVIACGGGAGDAKKKKKKKMLKTNHIALLVSGHPVQCFLWTTFQSC